MPIQPFSPASLGYKNWIIKGFKIELLFFYTSFVSSFDSTTELSSLDSYEPNFGSSAGNRCTPWDRPKGGPTIYEG